MYTRSATASRCRGPTLCHERPRTQRSKLRGLSQVPNRRSCLLRVELLRLLVECRALLDGHKALDSELLPRLLHSHSPAFDELVRLLAISRRLAAHDPPQLVLHEVGLRQPT